MDHYASRLEEDHAGIQNPVTQTGELHRKEKIAYGAGDIGYNFLFDLGQIYLLKFYTDTLGLPASIAGMVFLVTKIWDAFSDFTIGTVVDHRKKIGPKGKFRPFILYTAVPLALMTVTNFLSPDFSLNGKVIWAFATYMAFGTIYSISSIPYGSMAPAMTKNPNERAELSAFRQAGANLGLLITTVGFMPVVLLFDNPKIGYPAAAAIFATAGILLQIYSYKHIKERHVELEPKKTSHTIKDSYKALVKNGPLFIVSLVNLFTISAYNVKLAVQVYYCQYVLHNVTIVSYMGFFSMGCAFFGIALAPFVQRKIGKKYTYMFGCAIWAVADLLALLFAHNAVLFIVFACLAFFGNAFVNSLNWALISDCVEYGEWKTGKRTEGIVYSFFTFFRKLSQAVAGFIPGFVLSISGYVPNAVQSASAIFGIKALMFIYPAALSILTIVVFGFFYRLTEKKYKEIVAEMNSR
ncbi:MFS transporter [Heyndrickxia coagulans]|uniref:MFS transporter n=1 Tax=Heyndrickxia coagulans TaxID=1398 RepID=UPI001A94B3F1|nr:MFS transporter [Heyndrickxia coagulans]